MGYLLRSVSAFALMVSLASCTATDPSRTITAPTQTTVATPSSLNEPNTPDAVATAFLRALGSNDGPAVCRRMAINDRPLVNFPSGTITACVRETVPKLITLMPTGLADVAESVTVTGSAITGTTASFQNATFNPALAKDALAQLEAVQLDGIWYLQPRS